VGIPYFFSAAFVPPPPLGPIPACNSPFPPLTQQISSPMFHSTLPLSLESLWTKQLTWSGPSPLNIIECMTDPRLNPYRPPHPLKLLPLPHYPELPGEKPISPQKIGGLTKRSQQEEISFHFDLCPFFKRVVRNTLSQFPSDAILNHTSPPLSGVTLRSA